MKGTIIIVLAMLLAALIASAQSPVPTNSDPAKELQSYFDSVAAENKLSGVLLVAKDGKTIASKAAGVANKATKAAIDVNPQLPKAISDLVGQAMSVDKMKRHQTMDDLRLALEKIRQ